MEGGFGVIVGKPDLVDPTVGFLTLADGPKPHFTIGCGAHVPPQAAVRDQPHLDHTVFRSGFNDEATKALS